MELIILDYDKSPQEFERAIDAILSNLKTKISIISSLSGIILAVVLGAFIPLILFLVVSPEHFISSIRGLLSSGYNLIVSLIHLFQINILAGIVGTIFILIILGLPLLFLRWWFRYVSSDSFQTKAGKYTLIESLSDIVKEYDRYTKAKAYPKLWELHITLDSEGVTQFELKAKKTILK
jgi:hypothetical protein